MARWTQTTEPVPFEDMSMLAKLAVRNLLQHRSKSLIVGALMALGVALLVVGNSIMVSLDNKMEASFTHEYSGDLFIYPDKKSDRTAN